VLSFSIAFVIAILLNVMHGSMKDKKTECEARQFITEAHKRGNSAVKKIVDFTRQELGYTHQNKTKIKRERLFPSEHFRLTIDYIFSFFY
jgi:hypothetical protein